jgi:hypothetical protein
MMNPTHFAARAVGQRSAARGRLARSSGFTDTRQLPENDRPGLSPAQHAQPLVRPENDAMC